MPRLKRNVPTRSATDVTKGDYVKVKGQWERILDNTAFAATTHPRTWTVTLENGDVWGMYNIDRYAKAEDME